MTRPQPKVSDGWVPIKEVEEMLIGPASDVKGLQKGEMALAEEGEAKAALPSPEHSLPNAEIEGAQTGDLS